jgi:predicted transcriptional regulator
VESLMPAKKHPNLPEAPWRTEKQRQIMNILFDAVDHGEELSVKEIHARLPFTCAYGTLRDHLNRLKNYDLVYYEKAGMFNYYKPTAKAYAWFRPNLTRI